MIEKGLIPPVVRTGNLNSLRTWSDVRDAVRAYYMLVTVNPIPGQYYNIGGTFSCTVGEMSDYLISISTHKDRIRVETEKAGLRPLDADLQVPDTKKFRAHTGWNPEISFEQTMEDLLDYWRLKHGKELEYWWLGRFGFGFECITESEARYLLRTPDADRVRNKIVAAVKG